MTPEQIEKERGKFESWAIKHCYLNRDKDGSYTYAATQMAFEAWLARAEQSVWIRAEDMLPAEGSAAIVLYRDCGQLLPSIGYYCEDSEMFFDENKYEIWDVTHWQPLPTPPKGI